MAATVVSVCFVIEVYSLCVWGGGGILHAFAHVFTFVNVCVCYVGLYTVSAHVALQILSCNKSRLLFHLVS